jgi:diacylglycerol O-acyltransferase
MQLTQLPALLTSILGLGSRFPAFSTVVSNVPGPRKPLYWNGARLDGIYPASIVFDGFAMNITLVSYHDKLDFGIVACRRSMPQIQRIIDHLEDALQELEAVAGITARAGARRAPQSGSAQEDRSEAGQQDGKGEAGKNRKRSPGQARGKPRPRKPAKAKAAPKKKPKKQARSRRKARTRAAARRAKAAAESGTSRAAARPKGCRRMAAAGQAKPNLLLGGSDAGRSPSNPALPIATA